MIMFKVLDIVKIQLFYKNNRWHVMTESIFLLEPTKPDSSAQENDCQPD